MKITIISILEKMRAPSRIEFHKGLWCETLASPRLLGSQPRRLREVHRADGEPDGNAERSERADRECCLESVSDSCHESNFAQREAEHLHLPELGKTKADQYEAHDG